MGDLRTVFASGTEARARLEDAPMAQVALLVFFAVAIAAALLLLLPTGHRLIERGTERGIALATALYFGAVGLGFMLLEVALLQLLVRLVGEPGWALVTVLVPILAATGLGALVVAGPGIAGPRAGTALAAFAAAVVALGIPALIDRSADLAFAARLAIGAAATFAIAFPLGVPFAAAIARLERSDLVAWAFATNAVASVLAPLLAFVVGSAFGLDVAAGLAAASYGVAFLAARHLAPRRPVV